MKMLVVARLYLLIAAVLKITVLCCD